jgi:hypothetical protein
MTRTSRSFSGANVNQLSGETLFGWIRRTLSFKAFVEVELSGSNLLPYGHGKYYGKCRLPGHKESHGTSFLLDEVSGRCSCQGKCNLRGADMCQIGAIIWNCTNFEAAKRIFENRHKYGRKQETHNKGKKKEPTVPSWPWKLHLKPFPEEEIPSLARLRQIPELGIRRAIDLGLLWYLPERRWDTSGAWGSAEKGLGPKRYHRKKDPESWVITDQTRQQAMRRRLDGMHYYGGAKSKLLPGCSGKTQIGLSEALSCEGEQIVVVEGGPDLLAALGYFDKCGVVCMPSAYTDFCPIARRELARRRVLMIPHADEAGMKALARWEQQLGRKADIEWNEWLASLSAR